MDWLIILAVGYLGVCLYVRLSESRFIYYPHREIDQTPAALGWPFEEVTLTAADGVRTHGWWVPRRAKAVAGEDGPRRAEASPGEGGPAPGTTVLFLHGNAGNISHRLEKLAVLRELGANVLIIDYRGYGRSEGRPSEPGLYADARAAYDHLVGTRGVPGGRVILYGESLGSALAVQLATVATVGGVILEEPFTSIAEVGQKMFPFLPVRWLARSRYDAIGRIGDVAAPLLILHSAEDEMFPLSYAERLLAAAVPPKELVVLRGSHNDAFAVSHTVYRAALQRFLAGIP